MSKDITQARVLFKDGRFNYRRSFKVETLPKINGVPIIDDMDLPDIGIDLTSKEDVQKIIANTWAPLGVTL